MSHDSFFPAPLDDGAPSGFAIEAGGERLCCREVRGFAEALLAARDPLAPAPARLEIDGLDGDARAWLERWAEDADQVRRSLSIRHDADDAEVTVIATLASHGYGVPTSLAVESVRARGAFDIVRSGVHLRVDVEAVLAAHRDVDVDLGPRDPI